MRLQINKIENAKTVNWAHGTSTELFVFPADGNFQTRDFTFRISTATVEADETDFSDFTGLTRILLILEGNLTLIHEGRYTKQLAPFDQDTFDGGWKTKSKGRVRDFNLMFKEPISGNVEAVHCKEKEARTFALSADYDFFFVQSGVFTFQENKLSTNDLLVIEREKETSFVLNCIEKGSLVKVEISLNKN